MAIYYNNTSIAAKTLNDMATAMTSTSDKITIDTSGTSMIISMWDKITITYASKTANDYADFTISIDGTDVATGCSKLWYGERLEIIDDDNFLWVKFGSTQAANDTYHIVEVKEGNDIYAGYVIMTSASFSSTINNLSFTKIDSEFGGSNTVANIFNYTAYPGTLDYSDYSVFVGASGRIGATTAFKSCSNVTFLSSVSFNNKNYMAIGTNNIIEIDPINI